MAVSRSGQGAALALRHGRAPAV
ncbi:MAG: hypothetical protein JWO90_1709, partial [Solirubrobacterales bacterium]|nr:hypothetical protein [Solirubrobacterales bacterium]